MNDGPNRIKNLAVVWGIGMSAWAGGGALLGRVHLNVSEQLLMGVFIALSVVIWLLADIASNVRYLFILAVGESIKDKSSNTGKPDA